VGDPARGQVELADGLFGPLTEGELEGCTTTLAEVLARLKVMIAQAGTLAAAGEAH
jgi:hypothetical protein